MTPRNVSLMALAMVALTGCGLTAQVVTPVAASSPAPSATSPETIPTAAPSGPAPAGATVPGYPVGQFPAIPMFELPDLSMLDRSLAGFSIKVKKEIGNYPGVKVQPARCDKGGTFITSTSSTILYGDGSGTYTGPDGSKVKHGDGSGSYSINGVSVIVHGDGSGSYTDGKVSVISHGDGSGSYTDASLSIVLHGDGSGVYTSAEQEIVNYGDGAGVFSGGGVTITNYGDGSGTYLSPDISIINYGDGTGVINGVPTTGLGMVGQLPRLGKFPKMGVIKPIRSCGVRITIEDAVLFDFDRYEIRSDAAATLDNLAKVLEKLNVRQAVIGGHTDAIGTDEYNLGLSQRRADAVVAALRERGVAAALTAKGFGESQPVAPNELKGKDNPSGRQLNRRVEILIPAGAFK